MKSSNIFSFIYIMDKQCSSLGMVAWVLLLVGGINWGLVGAGMLAGGNWNVVNMLLGSMPTVEAVVYLLVGLSALMCLMKCKK